ncbi:MAG: hypothetical protein FWE63_06740 [Bacteroidales bacterium]|nr:hypothetical protein [Bacteroidales bacterium]
MGKLYIILGLIGVLTIVYLLFVCRQREILKKRIAIKNVIVKYWRKFICRPQTADENISLFHPLSPTDEIENGKNYFEALNWALSNRKTKNIRNIALTGSYGSGKSSILRTFQKENSDKDLHFLNISLATFSEEKEIENKTNGENLLRLIELSIIQQLFYKEKNRKLPDSRLKKIKKHTWWHLSLKALGYILFILAFVLLIKPNMLSHIFPKVDLSNCQTELHYCFLAFSILGVFFILYKAIRILHNLKISKLKISDAEIQINPDINKSILNHNLEEILYFFEATDYNVVIIEDLDRFKQTEIFTKLREINLLINNSKKIERDVVFIYAVRDDIFVDKDRTKFFDFIVPVIPFINHSNSKEILQQSIEKITTEVSKNLINDIALFIDEMRLLYNIINEFKIYDKILTVNCEEFHNKLLAMIVYKNICPNDFAKLGNNEGILYQTINKKQNYVKQESEKIEKETAGYKAEIKRLELLKIKDIKELRSLYVLQYVKEINKKNSMGITSFYLNDTNCTFDQVLEDEIFPHLISGDTLCFGNYNNRTNHIQLKFTDIEKIIDETRTYENRKAQIDAWSKNKISELSSKVWELERKRENLQHEPLKNLMISNHIEIYSEDEKKKSNQKKSIEKQKELINLLLRKGYIDEEYSRYISLFYEGDLSRNDNTFLINVKSQSRLSFDFQIDRIENLIEDLDISDFWQESILNFKLLNFILSNPNSSSYGTKLYNCKSALFSLLSNESDSSIQFINGYIDSGYNIEVFIKELCRRWSNSVRNIWKYIHLSPISDEVKDKYFLLIIKYAEITDITEISKNSNLKQIISEKVDFCSLYEEDKIKEILNALNIKFIDIDVNSFSDDMFDYVYTNKHYQINKIMLKKIIQTKGKFNQVDFDTQNYFAINSSDCDILVNYINENLKDYVTNVYLKIETNTNEREEHLIKLLNSKKLDNKDKIAIIEKVKTKIFLIEKIETVEIRNLLMQNFKAQANWENVIDNYCDNEQELKEHILTFLNDKENAESLSHFTIDKNNPDEETVRKFLRAIILNEHIKIDSYALLLNSVPYQYNSLSFENLPDENIRLLIKNNKLNLNKENYDKLKEKESDLHIKLVEKRKNDLLEKLSEFSIDDKDVTILLRSHVLSQKDKEEIINREEELVIRNSEILNIIGDLLAGSNENYDINKNILKAIFENLDDTDRSIRHWISVFSKTIHKFDNDDITNALSYFSEPYSNIARDEEVVIPKNPINAKLARMLKAKEYIKDFKIFVDTGEIEIYK